MSWSSLKMRIRSAISWLPPGLAPWCWYGGRVMSRVVFGREVVQQADTHPVGAGGVQADRAAPVEAAHMGDVPGDKWLSVQRPATVKALLIRQTHHRRPRLRRFLPVRCGDVAHGAAPFPLCEDTQAAIQRLDDSPRTLDADLDRWQEASEEADDDMRTPWTVAGATLLSKAHGCTRQSRDILHCARLHLDAGRGRPHGIIAKARLSAAFLWERGVDGALG